MSETQSVMCCITAQASCLAILLKGKELAEKIGCPVKAVTVQPSRAEAKRRSEDMICLDELTRKSGVEIDILYSDSPLLALAEYAEQVLPLHIFTGKQADRSSFVMKLAEYCKLPVSMVCGENVITVPTE